MKKEKKVAIWFFSALISFVITTIIMGFLYRQDYKPMILYIQTFFMLLAFLEC
jgi:hypothetical protein